MENCREDKTTSKPSSEDKLHKHTIKLPTLQALSDLLDFTHLILEALLHPIEAVKAYLPRMFGLFGGGKTFNPIKDIPHLAGKVILITGGKQIVMTHNYRKYWSPASRVYANSPPTSPRVSTLPLALLQRVKQPSRKSKRTYPPQTWSSSPSTSLPLSPLQMQPSSSPPSPSVLTSWSTTLESWLCQQAQQTKATRSNSALTTSVLLS